MSKGNGDPRPGKTGGPPSPRPADEKKIIVEFTKSFNGFFSKLPLEIQEKGRRTIEDFIDGYLARHFPKGMRAHKCGPFLSLSVTMNYRIFVLPISGGVKFVFFGTHEDANHYLKRK